MLLHILRSVGGIACGGDGDPLFTLVQAVEMLSRMDFSDGARQLGLKMCGKCNGILWMPLRKLGKRCGLGFLGGLGYTRCLSEVGRAASDLSICCVFDVNSILVILAMLLIVLHLILQMAILISGSWSSRKDLCRYSSPKCAAEITVN